MVAAVNRLIDEIGNGRIRPLHDGDDWDAYTAVYKGQDWLTPPWFFVETYFYRRVLEAAGYFGSGPLAGQDPFAHQKRHGLQTTMNRTRALAAQLQDGLARGWDTAVFRQLLAVDLWGNQADLSLWPADGDYKPDHAETQSQQAHLLIDETTAVINHLTTGRQDNSTARLDFIIDNAGFELATDLGLADYLLGSGVCQTVRFHLKVHPTFVSDALIQDVHEAIAYLQADSDANVRALGERLAGYLADGRLQLRSHPYWTSPLPGWEMPADLRQELAAAHLIISKGDANYRRLLGDRHWPFTTSFADVVSYLPAPLVALRTLKSDVLVGLEPGREIVLNQKDVDWLTNGRWGLIQPFMRAG
jgi:uncharacterized protein with ATP-grasp and redox domains